MGRALHGFGHKREKSNMLTTRKQENKETERYTCENKLEPRHIRENVKLEFLGLCTHMYT